MTSTGNAVGMEASLEVGMHKENSAVEAIGRLEERRAVLLAAADLFDEVAAFMDTVTPRTFDDYQTAATETDKAPLRLKHMQAMRIRDDYRSSAKENRSDVELLDAFRSVQGQSQ